MNTNQTFTSMTRTNEDNTHQAALSLSVEQLESINSSFDAPAPTVETSLSVSGKD